MFPEKILNRYLAMINDGSLVTLQGWRKAALFFELPSSAPRDMVIHLTTRHPRFGKVEQQGSPTEVGEMWVDRLGTMDSCLRYKPPPKEKLEGTIFLYRLVLTGTKWEGAADDGQPPGESAGAQEGRIEGSLKGREVAVDAPFGMSRAWRTKRPMRRSRRMPIRLWQF
jgi:hypothetical protein